MKKADLVSVGNELNGLLFEEDKPQIKVDKGAPEMKANIYEALKLLEPSDELTKETVATILECDFAFDDEYFTDVKKADELRSTLQKIGVWVNDEDKTDADDDITDVEEVEDTLVDQVKNAPTLKDLKKIAKVNDEFKSIRSGLTKYDDVDDLIADMLKLLDVEPAEEAKEEPTKKDKKGKKEKEGKKDKKDKKGKKSEKPEKKEKTEKEQTDKGPSIFATALEYLGKSPKATMAELTKFMKAEGFDVESGNGVRSAYGTMKRVYDTLEKYGHIK